MYGWTSSSTVTAFARTLRRARRSRELSQEALAAKAGLGAKHISEIERANKDPRLTTVIRLADALGMTPSELLRACEDERAAQHVTDRS
jgi:transcriptional regulator with XRE-family HTH domain